MYFYLSSVSTACLETPYSLVGVVYVCVFVCVHTQSQQAAIKALELIIYNHKKKVQAPLSFVEFWILQIINCKS